MARIPKCIINWKTRDAEQHTWNSSISVGGWCGVHSHNCLFADRSKMLEKLVMLVASREKNYRQLGDRGQKEAF